MSQIINIGVLGCANIALRSVLPAIHELPEKYRLAGIASRSSDTANENAKRFNTSPFVGYQSLLEIEELDAVYIPLPNALHTEWVENALQRGLHVLVEKSLACSYSEVQHVNNIASERTLVLVENFQFRFHRQLDVIRSLVQNGEIGNIRCLRSSFGFPLFPDKNNIRYIKELGGGALLDAGAYPIKIAQIFLGNEISVQASSMSFDSEKGIDMWGGGFLKEIDGDLFVQTAFGFDNFYQCNFEIWGSRATLSANRVFTSPPGHEAEIIIESDDGKRIIKITPDNHFKNMLLHFHTLILNPELANTEYSQNVNQARLIAEFREKANEG